MAIQPVEFVYLRCSLILAGLSLKIDLVMFPLILNIVLVVSNGIGATDSAKDQFIVVVSQCRRFRSSLRDGIDRRP
jgi:hypothetical protein